MGGGGDSHDRRLTYGVGAVCDDIVDFIFAGVFFLRKAKYIMKIPKYNEIDPPICNYFSIIFLQEHMYGLSEM